MKRDIFLAGPLFIYQDTDGCHPENSLGADWNFKTRRSVFKISWHAEVDIRSTKSYQQIYIILLTSSPPSQPIFPPRPRSSPSPSRPTSGSTEIMPALVEGTGPQNEGTSWKSGRQFGKLVMDGDQVLPEQDFDCDESLVYMFRLEKRTM